MKIEKTNVMRILDQNSIEYEHFTYDNSLVDGISIAKSLSLDPNSVFKTLVTVGSDHNNYVFLVPVKDTLDLKKAAKAVNVKSIEMIKQASLLPLTGYIHGGCSPIGMKKEFKTVVKETALLYDKIIFSGGKIGHQVKINPLDLEKIMKVEFLDI